VRGAISDDCPYRDLIDRQSPGADYFHKPTYGHRSKLLKMGFVEKSPLLRALRGYLPALLLDAICHVFEKSLACV
jgi:hypothetical protein